MNAKHLLAATVAAVLVTMAMAWPVIVAPATRIFGAEIVGRHHDPFTVMWQFEHERPLPPYRQPLVDDAGAALATVVGPVAAFNVVVLLSFPLSVLTTFVLARYFKLSIAGATIASFAFAFAPPHLAQAAYHPHVAQTQWIPLYILALYACVDRGTWRRAILLVSSIALLALSNLYGAFIAAVVAPVALGAAWLSKGTTRRARDLAIPVVTLIVTGLAALAVIYASAPALFFQPEHFAFQQSDLARYGARWWAYLLPPVTHPLWGSAAADVWNRHGTRTGLLEQQISLSWALMVLAGIAVWHWVRGDRTADGAAPTGPLALVPLLTLVGLWAAACSLAPSLTGPQSTSVLAPATWLYSVAPMFRSYARFAFITHLMVALLAGIGLTCLLQGAGRPVQRLRWRRVVAGTLMTIAAVEYLPFPARSRDVLPTEAHRWLATQPPATRILDCVPPSTLEALVPWLMGRDLTALSSTVPSCFEPNLAQHAATLGFTHVIVRRPSDVTALPPPPAPDRGLVLARAFPDASVYEVVGPAAPIGILATTGFSRTEHDGVTAWQWMEQQGTWIVQNAQSVAVTASLDIDMTAFASPRRVAVAIDGRPLGIITIGIRTERHRLGPWTFGPGTHALVFTALEPASQAPNPDPRRLTVMFRDWRWRH